MPESDVSIPLYLHLECNQLILHRIEIFLVISVDLKDSLLGVVLFEVGKAPQSECFGDNRVLKELSLLYAPLYEGFSRAFLTEVEIVLQCDVSDLISQSHQLADALLSYSFLLFRLLFL